MTQEMETHSPTYQPLLGDTWTTLTELERKKACSLAHQHGKVLATHLYERQILIPPAFPTPDYALYVRECLAGAPSLTLRDWQMQPYSKRLRDARVICWLDAYHRMTVRYRDEPPVPYEIDELKRILAETREHLEGMDEQLLQFRFKIEEHRKRKRWQDARRCQELFEQINTLRGADRVALEMAQVHLEAAHLVPIFLGKSLEDLYRGTSRKEEKEAQEDALSFVRSALVNKNPRAVQSACRQCLATGISPSDQRLWHPLLDDVKLIEEDERLKPLTERLQEELKERDQKSVTFTASVEPETERSLDETTREMLEAVLPFTEGRKAVMIGGTCNHPARRQLEETFHFDSLEWPEAIKTGNFGWAVLPIRSADLCFLNRFNRTMSKQTYRECQRYGTRLVKIGTYGVNHVIHKAYEQLIEIQERRGERMP